MNEKTNVLIIDDDESTRRSLKLILEKQGYEVEEAGTGREAAEKAQEAGFDVALLDIRLPDMGGVDLIAPLKEKNPDMAAIMITGFASLETAVQALDEGASAYIIKPLDMDEVLARVKDVVEKQRLVVENRRLYQAAQQELAQRKLAQDEIRRLNEELEERVLQRTVELEEVNKELETFSYSVSHNLRSPLRAIDGFSKILLKDHIKQLDDTGKDYLRRTSASVLRMAELIDALLDLSRLGRVSLHRDKVNLSEFALNIVSELREREPERKVEFLVEDGLIVDGDLSLLQTTMENLVGNAWKFTRERAQAKIEFGAEEKDGQRVYFVRDNGAGFDMAYADKLFGPFQRMHAATEFPGTGIGLATVQRIIHRHGGRIWAMGEVDRGATFYFTL